MRKIIPLILSLALVLALAACGSNDTTSEATTGTTAAEDTSTPTEVTITSLNGNGDPTDLTVPYDPQRIAILDMASLDILDALGLGDRVVGTASTSLDYLQSYINDEVENLGTIKEADLEAVMACEPDVIFIGGRLASSYDSLSEIAPVVYLATDTETGVVASVEKNARTIASLFGLEDQVDQLMEGFDSRIQALAAAAEGHTAIVGLVTSGSFNVLGNDGRCSIIGPGGGLREHRRGRGDRLLHPRQRGLLRVHRGEGPRIYLRAGPGRCHPDRGGPTGPGGHGE